MAINKEDAMIAMKVAEEKLYNRDYAGAKEMALMAEKLFPQLDNIAQLLAVCEVHCSAKLMDNGLYDWYKIIQVDSVSDRILIRKQYRRLALLLHPDKNKYPGAEAAFKLVAEANNTLSDRYKRSIYDVKRRHLVTDASWKQSTQMNAAHNFSSSNFNKAKYQNSQPQPHQGFTFWTACPSCRARHQYYLNILSCVVHCINCFRTFTADAPPHLNPGNMSEARNQPQQFPVAGTTVNGTESFTRHYRKRNPKPTTSNSSGSNAVTGQRRGKRVSADMQEPTADTPLDQNPNPSSQPKCSAGVVEAHDSNPNSKLASSNSSGSNIVAGQRRGKGVSADMREPSADPSPDPHPNPSSPPKCSTGPVRKHDSSPNPKPTTSISDGSNTVTGQQRGKRFGADMRESSADPSVDQHPNPSSQPKCSSDVSPNRGGRDQTNSSTLVSTSMPLRRSPSNNPDATNDDTEANILSPAKKAKFEVKGLQYGDGGMDVRNTGINANTTFEEEPIEQDSNKGKEQVKLSESAGDKGLDPQAANVGTYPDSIPETCIGAAALFEESHAVFKERNGREESTECRGFNPSNGDTSRVNRNDHTLTQRCKSPQPSDDAPLYEYPDAEFHNFDMCRTHNQFQPNQIWALYSDLDTNPKYYGWVRKVDYEPFKVHINWLEACPKSEVEKRWLNASLPISCGKFRVQTQNVIYDEPTYFSHMVTYHAKGKYYEILPEIGEVWAVYKNWSSEWRDHDLVKCEYDIVQIKKQREESMVVLPMRQVSKYKSVFMPGKLDRRGSDTREIPATKYILFSHRIPAVPLDGKHKGFWELDPASVPYTFFNRAE